MSSPGRLVPSDLLVCRSHSTLDKAGKGPGSQRRDVHCVQIIQHSGPLPASEDGRGEQKPLLWKPKEPRPSDDGSLLKNSRHSRNSRNKPQRMERNNVEGVLTLQLSHPNVVQTFKAATRPLEVCVM